MGTNVDQVAPSTTRNAVDLERLAEEILKTGFVLEFRVASELKTAGWTVISNKYYVDDAEDIVREIDLVAYKVTRVQHFDVYTVVIVSCKKSDSNSWALLAREANLKDPNADWWPLHAWSNDKAISYQLGETGKAQRYHEQLLAQGVTEAVQTPSVEVFAFQEMDKASGKPQNDKPIFASVTSLMKAQGYEIAALPARKKLPSVYQFNLITVVDTDLVRLQFEGSQITGKEIDTEQYLARYIVRKRETFSRIRFIKASHFSAALADYRRLHTANCNWFGQECDAFYKDLLKDPCRTAVFEEDFSKKVGWFLRLSLSHKFDKAIDIGTPSLSWDHASNSLRIDIFATDDAIAFLNGEDNVRQHVGGALKSLFRYEGKFRFDEDIPF